MATAVRPTRAADKQENPFREWLRMYGPDSVRFVREVIGKEPYPDQIDLLRAYDRRDRRIAKRTGHGVGKSTCCAWMIVHQILWRYPQKTLVTAPSAPQLFDALAAEVKAVISRLPDIAKQLIEVQAEGLFLKSAPDESFVTFRTSRAEMPEAMAGIHSVNTLLICDEASGIPDSVFDAMSGSLVDPFPTMVLIGNPVRTSGLFFDAFHDLSEMWTTFHTSCVGHPNVNAAELESKKQEYGEDSNRYRIRVLGEFPTGDEDTVIAHDLVMAALERDVEPLVVRPIWGVDVARFGNDTSALAKRRGNTLDEPVKEKKGWDTMMVSGWIKSEWDATAPSERPSEIIVDVIGYGAGVCDRLLELGLPARGINVSEAQALVDHRYANYRAELWFTGQAWFAAKDCNIRKDKALAAELIGPRFKYTSNGKILVESKDDMKKRGKPSPNKADAFLLTLASQAVSLIGGSKHSTAWNQPMQRKIGGIV
jgi:phage terminase large subunit